MKPVLILGLMSGTSHDGVDAALVKFPPSGAAPLLHHHCHVPYASTLRKKIKSAMNGTAGEICGLNFELGEMFAKAAIRCAQEAGVGLKKIVAVASHGQTVYHIPPRRGRLRRLRRFGSTLQIGEPAVIACRTGLPVVSDFRAADMAAGGHGAPLVPFADWVLFGGRGVRAVQNIGGIANVTVVTPRMEDVFAFDTGPGNCLIDEAAALLYGKPFDRKGRIAQSGAPDERLLNKLLGHPYFLEKPPKSTGVETFNLHLLKKIIKGRDPVNVIATLTHLTARSIRDAYERFIFPRCRPGEIILSGGGAKNEYLVKLLRELFKPVPVRVIDEYGIPASAKEAMSFAILAYETLSGRASNLPCVTGAEYPVILGKITPHGPLL